MLSECRVLVHEGDLNFVGDRHSFIASYPDASLNLGKLLYKMTYVLVSIISYMREA
jgi:hypothetical protein